MTAVVVSLIETIRAKSESIASGEGNLVQLVIDLAKDFVALKQQCKRRWLRELSKLGYHPRVASRYLAVGNSWWCDSVSPIGTHLTQRLPYDLHKLAALSQLSREDLEELLKDIDPQREGRSRVIKAVQRRQGIRAETERKAKKISGEDLLRKWDKYVGSTLDAIEVLGEDAATEAGRKELARKMEEQFFEIQDALDPQPEDEEGVGDSEDDEVGPVADQPQQLTVAPAGPGSPGPQQDANLSVMRAPSRPAPAVPLRRPR
jgi:hypothetical protein